MGVIRQAWGKVRQGRGTLRAEGRSGAGSRKSTLVREVRGVTEKVGLEM